MGVEPTTFRLQSGCSATKLYWLAVNSKQHMVFKLSQFEPIKSQKFSFNKITPT